MSFPYIHTVIRLIVPFLILRLPLFGVLATILVDNYDWKFFPFHQESDYTFYQTWDKTMDVYAQLFIVAVVLRWKDTLARSIALALFGYRIIGVVLFFFTDFRPLLLFFPNIFDNFVVLYLIAQHLFKKKRVLPTRKSIVVVLFALLIPKMFHEYFMHYLQKQPWEIYDFGSWMGLQGLAQEHINYLIWGGLLYMLPITALLLYLRSFTLRGRTQDK